VSPTHRFSSMGCDVYVAGASTTERSEIEQLFEEAERTFSRFLVTSELNRVNDAAGRVTSVSPSFAAALRCALWAAAETDGLVDPTLGEALIRAGYDRDHAQLAPDPREARPGPAGVWAQVRQSERLVWLPPATRLDLNGVVKALAVDAGVAVLQGNGWVSAGGDLATRGGVDVALPGGGAVRLAAGGLATSGSGRRRWLRAGVCQHHLIDPRTGAPADSPWEQVTVSGSSCMAADVAAKAAFLLGGDGPGWLDDRGIPGLFLPEGGPAVANRCWADGIDATLPCT
jgi:FAD:protein FMN transferase